MSNGKLKQAWADMKQRCNNKNIKSYKFYGARGITYCSEWEAFGPFEKWALENGFENTLSLDRIDVDGNYEPSNCRWATREQQDNNKRTSVYVFVDNERMTLKQAAVKSGIAYSTIQARYDAGVRGNSLLRPLQQGDRLDGKKKEKREPKYGDRLIGEIKWLSLNSHYKQKDIAAMYNVSQTFVSKVKLGELHEDAEGVRPNWVE